MCGIVGYVGQAGAAEAIIEGLKRLEYRGYDSAGIALHAGRDASLRVVKTPGKIASLEEALGKALSASEREGASLAIGHTRWATHGEPNQVNAHPHLSQSGRIAIVHNGIIDNYAALKAHLVEKGYTFSSQTDSEVIAHLVEECYDGDLYQAVVAAVKHLEGTYGIVVASQDHPDTIVTVRNGSPIVLGVCDDASMVASDICAILQHTNRVIFLNDGDVAVITAGRIDLRSLQDTPVNREISEIDWDVGTMEKAGYDHFMLKEIHEQPEALANATRGRVTPGEADARLGGLQMEPRDLARTSRIVVAACGTSYYAGMVGKYLFEELAGLPADVEQAAEFRYRNPILDPDTCVLAISQSGETADTLAAVREALRKGCPVLSICNVVGSTIARETGRGVYLHAGPEIGVASTKAFTCQVAVLAMMAIAWGRTRRLSYSDGLNYAAALASVPDLARAVLEQAPAIKVLAAKYAQARDFFFIGRGYMFPAALEGALKLKEISYIHAEGYHAAELKHGPIALLDETVPVVACVPDIPGKVKTLGNMQECRARQSPVIAIATEGDNEVDDHCDEVIRVPACPAFISAIPVVIAEQLFAYYVALERGCAIDQPKNLAKSVTVE